MILKGWGKIGLRKAWNNEFQLIAMEANTTSFLLIVTHDIEEDMEIDELCIDLIETT
jgi:hypothetical protein